MVVTVDDVLVGPLTPANGVSLISLDFDATGWDATWLKVYKSGSGTALVYGTDYTVANAGAAGASITLTTAANGTDAYSVYLETPLERTSDMQERGEFRSGPFNDEMDRLWQALQYISTGLTRALRVGPTDTALDALSPVDNRVLGFDATGGLAVAGSTRAEVDAAVAFLNGLSGVGDASDASAITYTTAETGGVARSLRARLGDIISVKDFGAVGDGVVDDTTAIDAAKAAGTASGALIFVPEGTYLYAGNAGESLGSSVLRMDGPGRIKSSGADRVFAQPLGGVFITGVEFQDFMKVVDHDSVAAGSHLWYAGCKFLQCGNTDTAGGRADFQGAIHAGTSANAIKTLIVERCYFDGEDFGVCYRSGFHTASVNNCHFENVRRMAVMLGHDNGSGDWDAFVHPSVTNCTFDNIVANDPFEREVHAALIYGRYAQIANCRVEECYDIHASIHDSEALYVRAERAIVVNNYVKNGGKGDGHINVKGGDRTIVSGNTVLGEAAVSTISGIYMDGASGLAGRVVCFGNHILGDFDRALLINGGGSVHGNRIQGEFSYGIFAILDASTGERNPNCEFDIHGNTIIQAGTGSAGIICRVTDGETVQLATVRGNTIRLVSGGAFSSGGSAFVQIEPYRVASGDRNVIEVVNVESNTFIGRSGQTPSGCLVGTNSGSGSTGGQVDLVTYKDNTSNYAGNMFRLAVQTAGDVGTFEVGECVNTNLANRALSSPSSATTGYCRNLRGSRKSETSGTTTITSGNTSRTVVMGLQDTLRPTSLANVTVKLNSSLGAATEFHVGNLTGDNFTITVNTDPGATVNFSWEAKNEYFY